MTTPAVIVEEELEKQKGKPPKRKESHDKSSGAGVFTYVALTLIVFLWVVPTLGILLTSLLMALAWAGWLGVSIGVALPIIASSLLFGWGVHRWHALIGVIAGHGLFNLALALLWHRVLL